MTIATGGLGSEVTVPATVVGLGTAAVGTWVAANANKNLNKGNGLIKNENVSNTTTANDKPTLSQKKDAVRKAQEKVGNNLPRGKGKIGPAEGEGGIDFYQLGTASKLFIEAGFQAVEERVSELWPSF